MERTESVIYRLETTAAFDRSFKKLDRHVQTMIKKWIDDKLVGCCNPRIYGKALSANMSGYWRYRIGDYRLICSIQDDKCLVLALAIGHRREVYKR